MDTDSGALAVPPPIKIHGVTGPDESTITTKTRPEVNRTSVSKNSKVTAVARVGIKSRMEVKTAISPFSFTNENSALTQRREKLAALRDKGVDPYGAAFETSGSIAEIGQKFKEGATLRAAGRITAHRDMGKSHFVDLSDATGRIQVYIHAKELGKEQIDLFNLLDLGDFIGVEGECFLTKTGEPTLKVKKFEVLSKSLWPLPEKWDGLQDLEARYRDRYVDLISNEQSRDVFQKRILMVREMRRFFEDRGFVEVET